MVKYRDMNKGICFIFVYCILFFGFIDQAFGQATEAKAILDTNEILIGKQVQLILELKQDKNQNFQWPMIPDTIGKVEIVNKGNIDTIITADADILYRRQSLTVTAFDSGYFVIPPFDFLQVKGSDTSIASTNPLLLTVMIMPIDTSKAIHDIKALADVPFNWRDYIMYVVIGLSLIVIILSGIYIYLRFWKKVKLTVFPPKPITPAHEIALTALKKLDDEKQWQNGRYKYYHSSISDIIRTFIEQRWHVHAMEQTTDEIVQQQPLLELAPDARRKLEALLRLSDLAKFAKFQPLANDNEQSMRDAVLFVGDHALAKNETQKEVEKS